MRGEDDGVEGSAALDEAARRAAAGDWVSAKGLYQIALSEQESGGALEGLARSCWWLGEFRAAVDHAQRACHTYQRARQHAEASRLGVHLCIWFLTNFDNVTAARGWLARAQRQATLSEDPVAVGWTDLIAGYLAEDRDAGRRAIERAAAAAESASDADLATMALADLGLWHVYAGDVDRGMAMLDEAMAATLAIPRGMLEVVVWSSCNMLAACSMLDDLRRASDWCREAEAFMATYGCPFLQARCRAHYGRVLVACGRWQEAEAELSEALSMSADTGRGPRTEALTGLAELRLRQGEPETALQLLEDAELTPEGAITRAACLLATGHGRDARALLHARLAGSDPQDPVLPALVAALVDTDVWLGEVAEAEALVRAEAEVWRVPAFPRAAALLARAAGLVALAQGDSGTARARLAFALDVFARMELPFESARTEYELATALVASDPQAATARATSALKRLERLGARQQAAQVAHLLRSLGVRPAPGARTGDVLSARERDVLLLLAEGLTNREIGARLYVSPRTVGHHVSSILRKLGLRSRGEATAYATRVGVQQKT